MVVPESYSPDDVMREEFRAWQKKHPNFMTPKIRRLYVAGDLIVEVAEGTGFPRGDESVGPDIFGVSLWKRVGEFKFEQAGRAYGTSGQPIYNLLLNDFREAESYAKSVRRTILAEKNRYEPSGDEYATTLGREKVNRRPEVRVRGHERRMK